MFRLKENFSSYLSFVMMVALTLTLTVGVTTAEVCAASAGLSVVVDGKKVQFNQEPVIKDGRTLVPLRAIFEAMNMQIHWEQTTRSVQATKGNVKIKLQIGNKTASVGNDELSYIETVLDVEPQIINGSTLVPVRFVGEVSGSDVTWDPATKTVTINSKTGRSFEKQSVDATSNYLGYVSSTSKAMDGFGKLTVSEYVFIGTHVNGLAQGQATLTFSNGDKYVGNFKDDQYNGKGTLSYANGDKYVGEFKDDAFHGQGTYTCANGDQYVGSFADDQFNGQGTLTFADGEKYVSEFKDDVYHGQGTYIYANGDQYVGSFVEGEQNGQGTLTFADGEKYVGEFKDGAFHGQGTYTYSDGSVKKGTWVMNELK